MLDAHYAFLLVRPSGWTNNGIEDMDCADYSQLGRWSGCLKLNGRDATSPNLDEKSNRGVSDGYHLEQPNLNRRDDASLSISRA